MVHNVYKIDFYEPTQKGAICKVCRLAGAKKYKFKMSDYSLTSLIKHVKQHPEYIAKLAKMEDKSQEVAVMNSFVVRLSGGMSSLDKKVINFVVENCTSFNAVERRSFIFFNSSNSTEKLKGRRHFSGIVLPCAYAAVVHLIKAKLSFTTDICLAAHGINEEWRPENFVLAIREMPGSHTADVINATIKRIL